MRLTDINPHLFDNFYDDEKQQIKNEFLKNGFPAVDVIIDGSIHRFPTRDKKGDDSGWYIFFQDSFTAGMFGDWRSGTTFNFCAAQGRELTADEMDRQKKAIEAAKEKRDAERKQLQAEAAKKAQSIIDNSIPATDDFPYLTRKKVKAHDNTFLSRGSLVVPLCDYTGKLTSLQFISASGEKKFLFGGEVKNCFFVIGQIAKKIFICEGYATGSTIHTATGCGVIVCFSAGNIPGVARLLRAKYGTAELVIVADNDESKTGEKSANEAAESVGASVIMPPVVGQDVNDFFVSGGDVVALLTPPKKPWLVAADDFCAQPSPIKWIVKHWIPEESFIMTHGASGSGKTFLVLDLCLHSAAGFDLWHGSPVSQSTVVYLAGEGHAGLKARIAAWKQEFKPTKHLNMYVSQSGKNIDNKIERQKIIEEIRGIGTAPKLIVIDTLHCFMEGDENSSQDAGIFIDACASLREEFNCSVLLVHHTGNSEDAQKRARGSSAWRASLDIEISVKAPAQGGMTMTVEQLKNKDAELAANIFLERKVIPISGWVDCDGEQVTSLILRHGEKPKTDKPPKGTEPTETLKVCENIWQNGNRRRDDEGGFFIDTDELAKFFTDCGLSRSQALARTAKEISGLVASGTMKQAEKKLFFLDKGSFLRLTN